MTVFPRLCIDYSCIVEVLALWFNFKGNMVLVRIGGFIGIGETAGYCRLS